MLVPAVLLDAVTRAATELPPGQVEKLAAAIELHDVPNAVARHKIVGTVPTALFRHWAQSIVDEWTKLEGISMRGTALALSLRAAGQAAEQVRGTQQVSVVWTGPAGYDVPVRATSAVLAEVIDEARKKLTVVSFAAYKVDSIVGALRAAAERGVDVRLILESATESKGKLSQDAKLAFEALGDSVRFYVWPAELRLLAAGPPGSMHVKCAVADRRVAFVTSANLTGAAMNSNMELGLVVRGGDVPRRIADHFDALVAAQTLRRVV